jgi:hypothetical protein
VVTRPEKNLAESGNHWLRKNSHLKTYLEVCAPLLCQKWIDKNLALGKKPKQKGRNPHRLLKAYKRSATRPADKFSSDTHKFTEAFARASIKLNVTYN